MPTCLPARLDNARDSTLACKFAEAAAAHIKFAHIPVRATANGATIVFSNLELGLHLSLVLHAFSGHDSTPS